MTINYTIPIPEKVLTRDSPVVKQNMHLINDLGRVPVIPVKLPHPLPPLTPSKAIIWPAAKEKSPSSVPPPEEEGATDPFADEGKEELVDPFAEEKELVDPFGGVKEEKEEGLVDPFGGVKEEKKEELVDPFSGKEELSDLFAGKKEELADPFASEKKEEAVAESDVKEEPKHAASPVKEAANEVFAGMEEGLADPFGGKEEEGLVDPFEGKKDEISPSPAEEKKEELHDPFAEKEEEKKEGLVDPFGGKEELHDPFSQVKEDQGDLFSGMEGLVDPFGGKKEELHDPFAEKEEKENTANQTVEKADELVDPFGGQNEGLVDPFGGKEEKKELMDPFAEAKEEEKKELVDPFTAVKEDKGDLFSGMEKKENEGPVDPFGGKKDENTSSVPVEEKKEELHDPFAEEKEEKEELHDPFAETRQEKEDALPNPFSHPEKEEKTESLVDPIAGAKEELHDPFAQSEKKEELPNPFAQPKEEKNALFDPFASTDFSAHPIPTPQSTLQHSVNQLFSTSNKPVIIKKPSLRRSADLSSRLPSRPTPHADLFSSISSEPQASLFDGLSATPTQSSQDLFTFDSVSPAQTATPLTRLEKHEMLSLSNDSDYADVAQRIGVYLTPMAEVKEPVKPAQVIDVVSFFAHDADFSTDIEDGQRLRVIFDNMLPVINDKPVLPDPEEMDEQVERKAEALEVLLTTLNLGWGKSGVKKRLQRQIRAVLDEKCSLEATHDIAVCEK